MAICKVRLCLELFWSDVIPTIQWVSQLGESSDQHVYQQGICDCTTTLTN